VARATGSRLVGVEETFPRQAVALKQWRATDTAAADQGGTDKAAFPAVEGVCRGIETLVVATAHFLAYAAAAATDSGTARRIGETTPIGAVIAAFATIGDVAVGVNASAVAANPTVAAGIAAGAAVVNVALEVDAPAVTTCLAGRAGVTAGATVLLIGLKVFQADPAATAAWPIADWRVALLLEADARAQIATGPAVIGVGRQVVDTRAVTAGLGREATDIAANLVAARTGSARPRQTDLGDGTGGATGPAVITVGGQIAARAGATTLPGGASGRATAAVRLVDVKVVALGRAPAEAGVALTLVALAPHPGATVVVPVAPPAEVLAGHRHLNTAGQQGAREQGAEDAAA